MNAPHQTAQASRRVSIVNRLLAVIVISGLIGWTALWLTKSWTYSPGLEVWSTVMYLIFLAALIAQFVCAVCADTTRTPHETDNGLTLLLAMLANVVVCIAAGHLGYQYAGGGPRFVNVTTLYGGLALLVYCICLWRSRRSADA